MLHVTLASLALLCGATWAQEGNTYYTIFAKDFGDTEGNSAITKDLYSKIDETIIHHCQSAYLGTFYWYAPLSDDNALYYKDKVREITTPDTDGKSKFPPKQSRRRRSARLRKRETASQPHPSKHLEVVSQPQGAQSLRMWGSTKLEPNYNYDSTAGQEPRVYIIDSGLKPDHKEFSSQGNALEWLWAGPFSDTSKKDDSDENGHGTALASVAVGVENGVAKAAALTVVRCDRWSKTPQGQERSSLGAETWLDGLAQVHDDIKRNDRNGKAVVSMSIGFNKPYNKEYLAALEDAYSVIINANVGDLDCPVLVATGQRAAPPDDTVVTVPATLAESRATDIILISGCELPEGNADQSTRDASYVRLLAPADNIQAASLDGKWARVRNTKNAISNGVATKDFAAGDCKADTLQYKYTSGDPNHGATIMLYGSDGRIIGGASSAMTNEKPLKVLSKLPNEFQAAAQADGDYIAFHYGDQSWPSNGKFGDGDAENPCRVTGDWRTSLVHADQSVRGIPCTFTCEKGDS